MRSFCAPYESVLFTCEPFFRTDAVFARCEKAGPAVLKHTSFESAHCGFVSSTEAHISYSHPSQVEKLGIWSIVRTIVLSADLVRPDKISSYENENVSCGIQWRYLRGNGLKMRVVSSGFRSGNLQSVIRDRITLYECWKHHSHPRIQPQSLLLSSH